MQTTIIFRNDELTLSSTLCAHKRVRQTQGACSQAEGLKFGHSVGMSRHEERYSYVICRNDGTRKGPICTTLPETNKWKWNGISPSGPLEDVLYKQVVFHFHDDLREPCALATPPENSFTA